MFIPLSARPRCVAKKSVLAVAVSEANAAVRSGDDGDPSFKLAHDISWLARSSEPRLRWLGHFKSSSTYNLVSVREFRNLRCGLIK